MNYLIKSILTFIKSHNILGFFIKKKIELKKKLKSKFMQFIILSLLNEKLFPN